MSAKPVVMLPDGSPGLDWPESGRELFKILAETGHFFLHTDKVVCVEESYPGTFVINELTAAQAITAFEEHVQFKRGSRTMPLSREVANTLLNSTKKRILPALDRIEGSAVLEIGPDGELRQKPLGYDSQTHCYHTAKLLPSIDFEEAIRVISVVVLGDFHFRTDADRSRALLGLLAPALLNSGLATGRAPVIIVQADGPGAGKTYLITITTACYGARETQVTQQRGGVGSVDEGFARALSKGDPFIQFDNVRGSLDSTILEQFATGDGPMDVRLVRSGYIQIDRDRFFVSITSNGFEPTHDLLNRSLIVDLVQRPDANDYRGFPEGDLKDHIRANQDLFMSAIVAIIKEWHAQGAQRTNESNFRNGFRDVIRVCDWIGQNFFRLPPVLDNMQERCQLLADRDRSWLRQVCLHVRNSARLGDTLRSADLADLLSRSEIEIPGLSPSNRSDIQAGAKLIGCVMANLFNRQDEGQIDVDGFVVSRWSRREHCQGEASGTTVVRSYRIEESPG